MDTIKLLRVDNIQQAFDAGVPLYTSNGQYRVTSLREGAIADTYKLGMALHDAPPGNHKMLHMDFTTDGRLWGWPDNHPFTIMGEPAPITPDRQLRELMYPNYTEHVMD